MNGFTWLQIAAFFAVLIALVKPLGSYMAAVYENSPCGTDRILRPVERLIYRLSGIRPDEEMGWKTYALALLAFNFIGFVALYAMQRLQPLLPFNPRHLGAISPDSAFNTAVSFVTNTNWQGYAGETTMSHFTQMAGLTVQNFVSAATGMAVLVALIRGIARRSAETIGNFWFDLVRSTLYILLPLSIVMTVGLVSQGVVQTLSPDVTVRLVDPPAAAAGHDANAGTLAIGPAASQIAIKQLGTNGGGFFNANSAHPFENATPFSNFLEMLAILLIPAALTYTYGRMVRDTRQGWTIFTAMFVVLVAMFFALALAEGAGNPALARIGVDAHPGLLQGGGNMEGKEVRFGIAGTALFSTLTTAVSCGAVNSMHDSFTPLGGLVVMWLIQLGEVIFGGVGSGLYGMLAFVIVAVFVAGLMVGRTPEYLGKKIEAFEMKMASLAILASPIAVLIGTAVGVSLAAGRATVLNPGPHGFSEILYAFSSAANNNGSAFAGLGANTPFYNLALGLAMLVGRFWIAVPILAIAGSLARKKSVPESPGTLPTHGPLFATLIVGTVILVGALTFIPALALGPIVEHLMAVTS